MIAWRGKETDNLYFFLLDQVLHLLTIYLFTPPSAAIEKWVVIGCLAVLATHFTNIFLYYFEKLTLEFRNSKFEFPKVYTPEKYYSLIERLLILICLLLPGKWWLIVFIFLPLRAIIKNTFFFNPQGKEFSLKVEGINYSLALLWGILARVIYYT